MLFDTSCVAFCELALGCRAHTLDASLDDARFDRQPHCIGCAVLFDTAIMKSAEPRQVDTKGEAKSWYTQHSI